MRPKKSLSQYFLTSRSYLSRISEAINIQDGESLLEIGSGRGELTEFLVAKNCPLSCVEIDSQLCRILESKFGNLPRVNISCRDIRDFKIDKGPLVVAGNIPYHISFEIIEFIIGNRRKISWAFLLFQKEFAQKLAAKINTKNYGFLAVFLGVYAEPKIIFNIPKSCFFPQPKVDSALVQISFNPQTELKISDENAFRVFVRNIFSQRRKKISNVLKKLYPHKDNEKILAAIGISSDLRPEDITPCQFSLLFENLSL